MTLFETDINRLLSNMKSTQDSQKYYSYIKMRKNIIYSNDDDINIINKKQNILNQQTEKEAIVNKELELFDSFGIPLIGMKGPFIKSEYYGKVPRVYNDLDLLVKSSDAKQFYEKLKKHGYRIEAKTMYDSPMLNMKFIPKLYMENTQTLMLYNKKKNISIDLHSNLNITNAHFVKSHTKFSTNELFENSKQYKNFKNIRQLDIHDNLCFIIRHLLKHHIFYGKTQTGLKTVIQHIMDFSVVVNSKDFSENEFKNKTVEYNLSAEAVFCINLYNSIFVSCKKIEIKPFYDVYKTAEKSCKWRCILEATQKMDITDLMIGDFEDDFPMLYHSVEFCQRINNYKLAWFLQALVINPFAIKYLSKK